MKNKYGGLQVIKIGESFKSESYPGEFVPYGVKLTDGSIKKWSLHYAMIIQIKFGWRIIET